MAKAPTDHRQAFAARLSGAIAASDVTRPKLAKRLGVHPNTMAGWTSGKRDCPVGWLPTIAQVLGVGAEELLPLDVGERPASSQAEDSLAELVVETLEHPLTAPDLMELLRAARARLRHREGDPDG